MFCPFTKTECEDKCQLRNRATKECALYALGEEAKIISTALQGIDRLEYKKYLEKLKGKLRKLEEQEKMKKKEEANTFATLRVNELIQKYRKEKRTRDNE